MKDQDPLTAKLGKLGGADSQGFAGESILPTRQITITDAQATIVYDKRTTDTAKAADSHIRNIKYRRTGEWIDGIATVEPIPITVRNWKRLKLALVAAVAVIVICAFIAVLLTPAPIERDATYADANELAKSYERAVDGVKCERTTSSVYTDGWHYVSCDGEGSAQVFSDLDMKMVVINRNPLKAGQRRLYAANWMIFADKDKVEAAQEVLGGKISGD